MYNKIQYSLTCIILFQNSKTETIFYIYTVKMKGIQPPNYYHFQFIMKTIYILIINDHFIGLNKNCAVYIVNKYMLHQDI